MSQPSSRWRFVASKTIVENPNASAATAVVLGRISGLHGALVVGIAVAYFPVSRKAVSPAGSTFKLYGRVQNEQGDEVVLSSVPVNGTSGQTAPDAWEGTTSLPALDLEFDVTGINVAADVGRWDVIVTITPAIPLCKADFDFLAGNVAIEVNKVTL